MTDEDTGPVIEDIEPVFWNGGVTAHVEQGNVVVEVFAPDPMPLTPHPFIPSY